MQTNTKDRLIKAYLQYVEKNNKHPNIKDIVNQGFTQHQIRHHFVSITNLRAKLKKEYPVIFKDIIDETFFTRKNFLLLKNEISKYKKFIITTAVNGCKVHEGFLASLENYCKVNNAALLILPSNDPAHNLDNKYSWNFDSVLSNKFFVFDDLSLNSNLFICTILLGAKQIDPTTGLARIGQRNGSFIYASPKQRLKMVAVGNNKLPHAIMTTGAITKPDYRTSRFMGSRTAYIANNDHLLGAVIVEIENDKIFHFRQVQADNDGRFFDLGKCYTKDSCEGSPAKALVLGDLHSGDTDPIATTNWVKLTKEIKPEILILHDVFNGCSVNHHSVNKHLERASLSLENKLNLEEELRILTNDLNELSNLASHIVIVKSNHDEFLERYLNEMRFKEDPQNIKISLMLASEVIKGNNPVKFGVEYLGLKNPNKFTWLKRDDNYKIADIQLASHGDKGSNGAKGSLQSSELAYGNCIVGHSHVPEILRNAWCVGTSTHLKLSYNVGTSAWVQSSCIVYKNGSRQLINVIDGKYKT